jgi:hypothetical protein
MLFQQLKNASNWVFNQLAKLGKGIADAEDRMVESMFRKAEDKDESKKK